jgi:ferredoxin
MVLIAVLIVPPNIVGSKTADSEKGFAAECAVRVTFTPLATTAEAKPDETVLDVARRAGVPLGNSCGGIGICGRCKVQVLRGAETLTPPTQIESRWAAAKGFEIDERMACQAVVRGEVEVTTGYW